MTNPRKNGLTQSHQGQQSFLVPFLCFGVLDDGLSLT
jgi:hypothetical protein